MAAATTATKPAPKVEAKAEKNHEVSRTVYINRDPVKIEFAYDMVADAEQARANKEAAFSAALAKKYPVGLVPSRMSKFHYTLA